MRFERAHAPTRPNSHVVRAHEAECAAVRRLHGSEPKKVDVHMLQRTRWHCISEMNTICMEDRLTSKNILCHNILERL